MSTEIALAAATPGAQVHRIGATESRWRWDPRVRFCYYVIRDFIGGTLVGEEKENDGHEEGLG